MSIVRNFILDNFKKKAEPLDCKRIEFIDLAKGICILIVVFLHADYSWNVLVPLFLPLFFIVSGYFFNDYGGLMSFTVKKVNQLVIPLLFFFLIGLTIRIATNHDISVHYLLRQPFVEPIIQNAPIWFLICMFWINMFYYFVHTKVKNIAGRMAICLGFGLIGMALDYYNVYLPLFLSSAFTATPFFFVGVLLRKTALLSKTRHDKAILISAIVILLSVVAYCITEFTPGIIFYSNEYFGNYLEIMIVSVLMVICFLILCKAVKWLPVVSYFGRYSIIVLGVHDLFLGYAYLPVLWLTGHAFSQLEILGLALLLTWISIPLFNKFFKKFCGQDNLIDLRSGNILKKL